MRQPIEILPWALLSLAALVLSGTAADALRQGAARPDLQAFEGGTGSDGCSPDNTACASKAPRRYVLAADAFALDSAELPPELMRPLDAVAQGLREHGAHAVRIEVHTDASGPSEARRTLTQRRAEAIKAYLIERGIDATTVACDGHGLVGAASRGRPVRGGQPPHRGRALVAWSGSWLPCRVHEQGIHPRGRRQRR